MEKFDNNLFMKIGNWFFINGLHYKTGGIKAVYNYYRIGFTLKWFRWRYKHSKSFRDKVIKTSNEAGELFGRMIIENVFLGKPIDYKYLYDSLTDEQKVTFNENVEKAIQMTIKEHNITDENEIENLRNMFNFDDKK